MTDYDRDVKELGLETRRYLYRHILFSSIQFSILYTTEIHIYTYKLLITGSDTSRKISSCTIVTFQVAKPKTGSIYDCCYIKAFLILLIFQHAWHSALVADQASLKLIVGQ